MVKKKAGREPETGVQLRVALATVIIHILYSIYTDSNHTLTHENYCIVCEC